MVLILTPLRIEHEALTSTLGPAEKTERVGTITISRFAGQVVTAVGGHGKVQFALTTQHLVAQLRPDLVVCAGACGALDPRVKILDLVAATETVEHDFNLKVLRKPLPRFPGDDRALEKLRAASGLHFGPIASGDEDITDRKRAQELQSLTGAVAVGWEGAGGARACQFAQVPFLEVRVATDLCDPNVAQDFMTNVRAGMARLRKILDLLKD